MMLVFMLGFLILGVQSYGPMSQLLNLTSDSNDDMYISRLPMEGQSLLRVRRGSVDMRFAKEVLDEHNKYRRMHGVPPLTLSTSMCNKAQNYADKLTSIGWLKHSGPGENLSQRGVSPSGKEIVSAWYNEISSYKNYFGKEPPSGLLLSYGHFTQVVWKGSRELGVGLAKKNGKSYVVAQYNPPGNMRTDYANNVPRAKA
ncbi:Golgi-associated plant pathogenesis-related protein 1 [Eurytemora carolleeae]|uniref:Golgi-associated plant pathogenesis-related protein 1 n=1 Tax=Eurytemora carolleeae TaxID=1294199 RepID=UPI000C75CD41|nr:Golgi-associated plant pathogenesis-related protein 1 [Eurytemora carolleeae]|eukprot:XP_023323602.1 Golgi-associated plant pathogenesis-related protein 1-like [Eurytemora affinis]